MVYSKFKIQTEMTQHETHFLNKLINECMNACPLLGNRK